MSTQGRFNTCVYCTGFRTLEEASEELIHTGWVSGALESASEPIMSARIVENIILHELLEEISNSFIDHSQSETEFLSWEAIRQRSELMSTPAKECVYAFWELARERAEREDQERSWETK